MTNRKFVEIYGEDDFRSFKNTSIFIRDRESNGDKIIFAYDETIPPSLNNGTYIITIDDKNNVIKKTSCHLMKDSTIIDRIKLERLALKFDEYPIGNLSVDSTETVLISLSANNSPDLVRFSHMKFKSPKYDTWMSLKGNWYEKK